MPGRKKGRRSRHDVGFSVDKLVIAFFCIPVFPWMLPLSGLDEAPPARELPGLLVLTAILWGIAAYVGSRAGGGLYVATTVAFVLFLSPLFPWVSLLDGDDPPRGEGLRRLLATTPLFWSAAALIAWRFRVGPFTTKQERHDRHRVTVVHADPPEKDYEPYFIALCDCGWMGGFHDVAGPAFADAHGHSTNVDPEVQRPLDGAPARPAESS